MPRGGLEPPRLAAHEPESCVSTKFHHLGERGRKIVEERTRCKDRKSEDRDQKSEVGVEGISFQWTPASRDFVPQCGIRRMYERGERRNE